MKAVILAGGLGTRFAEETHNKPKPMIEIGGKPILWHIMKKYATYGINEFVICSGYMSHVIEDYFNKKIEDWEINVINTGENTMTGGRLKRVEKYVGNETFCFTYGDSLNDANISEIIEFHKKKQKIATVTACNPPEKYGILKIKDDNVEEFQEKPNRDNEWVNAGYFVLEPKAFELIKDDTTIWEEAPMKQLVAKNQLVAYKHKGFYRSMDTQADRNYLEKLWKSNMAKWNNWT